MPFCTLLEWDADFDMARYDELAQRSGGQEKLPKGCLARIVGPVATGARVIEVWESEEDARRFSEENTPLIREVRMPAPTAVATFETTQFVTRGKAG